MEPWPEAVDTGELMASLVARIKRHIVLSDDEALTVALWVLFAWVHDAAAVHSPILLATSAEPNSGKTQLLSLVGFLVPRALVCVEISEATLFRGIEKWPPTIIVDEADVILINNEPLRSVINSGWTRGSCVPRCIGDDNTPHAFPTFCPKVIGMKGRKLPDTTLSRSIIIEMRRKKAAEKVRRISAPSMTPVSPSCGDGRCVGRTTMARNLKVSSQICRPASTIGSATIGHSSSPSPTMPAANGRNEGAQGGDQAVEGCRRDLDRRAGAHGIKVAFDGPQEESEEDYTHREPLERISSADLAATLGSDPTGPWAEWKGGKPITQAQLARVLKPHGIAPIKIRLLSGGTLQGYMRSPRSSAAPTAWRVFGGILPPCGKPTTVTRAQTNWWAGVLLMVCAARCAAAADLPSTHTPATISRGREVASPVCGMVERVGSPIVRSPTPVSPSTARWTLATATTPPAIRFGKWYDKGVFYTIQKTSGEPRWAWSPDALTASTVGVKMEDPLIDDWLLIGAAKVAWEPSLLPDNGPSPSPTTISIRRVIRPRTATRAAPANGTIRWDLWASAARPTAR